MNNGNWSLTDECEYTQCDQCRRDLLPDDRRPSGQLLRKLPFLNSLEVLIY